MEPVGLQQLFFRHLKAKLPSNLSMADEVAELLGISNDSAYRRIRGEKPITLDEIQKLCTHYRISVDQLLNAGTDSTVFYGQNLDGDNFDCKKYLDYLLSNLKLINTATEKMIWYDVKDMPLFHFFQYSDLAAFKLFFWMKTALSCPGYHKMNFEDHELSGLMNTTGHEIMKAYSRVPTTEIWNIDSLNATIRQIEYYSDSGVFRKKETIALLFDQMNDAIEHIKEQAECGEKFLKGGQPQGNTKNFQLYYNEMLVGHNTVLIEADGISTAYINHGVMNQLITRDTNFCDFTKKSMHNLVRKSLLISAVGEKERNRFFNILSGILSHSRAEALK